ncbi:MAG: RluA family pseudouridine synthase [Planctomycetes bacterium]|nr:RluA family pseudouridine synthase [Planctomycetota bacterium]
MQAAARDGHLLLNGEPVGVGVTLRQGDELRVAVPLESLRRRDKTRIAVLYRDGALVVGSKPSGLAFDAGRHGGGRNALEALRASLDTEARPRAVHRLDKPTSGVIVAALDNETERALLDALRDERAHVEYLAVVRGRFPDDEGVIDLPLGKRKKSDAVLRPDPHHGTPCATAWRVLERLSGFAILRLQPRQGGRSHQVRAHMASIGYPILCDRDYGEDDRLLMSQLKIGYRRKRGRPERPLLEHPALHAQAFVLDDLRVEAPLPDDMTVLLAQLRRLRGLGGEPSGDDD